MPFSFTPGQEQQPGGVAQSTPAVNKDGVPVLQVPTIPTIVSGGNVEEKISPFAFRNRNKSNFGVYFQGVILFVFGCIALTTIGLFVYKGILMAQITSMQEELNTKQASFPKIQLNEMVKFSDRLKKVNEIMNERASIRTAFEVLEATIQNPVTYNKFSLSKSKTKKGFFLSFGGETNSYHSLYQQIEAIKSKDFNNVLSNVTISGTGPLDKKGVGSFKVDAQVKIEGIDPDEKDFRLKKDISNNVIEDFSKSTTTDINGQVIPSTTLIAPSQ